MAGAHELNFSGLRQKIISIKLTGRRSCMYHYSPTVISHGNPGDGSHRSCKLRTQVCCHAMGMHATLCMTNDMPTSSIQLQQITPTAPRSNSQQGNQHCCGSLLVLHGLMNCMNLPLLHLPSAMLGTCPCRHSCRCGLCWLPCWSSLCAACAPCSTMMSSGQCSIVQHD